MSKTVLIWLFATLILNTTFAADAQQLKKTPRIGILEISSQSGGERRWGAFGQRLRELGYVEGQSIAFEYRYAYGKIERLAELAAELVRLRVDVIATSGFTPAQAVKNATGTIPIVIEASDPVGSGLVASLARPGGNITGFASLATELAGKRFELIKDVLPKVSRVAALYHTGGIAQSAQLKELESVAHAFGVRIQPVGVAAADDFDNAFSAMVRERAEALFVLQTSFFAGPLVSRIVELAAKHRLPAVYGSRTYPEAGGLMSYGTDVPELYRQMASYVDKILKGTKPAELPVQQPMRFDLIFNLKAAKQIGLTISPEVLARATLIIK